MIVLKEPCSKCGCIEDPIHVACDYCKKEFLIETYEGIIVHFDPLFIVDSDGEEIEVEEEDDDDTLDFHFCGTKCMVEYLNDPNLNGFSEFEERNVAIFMAATHVDSFIYLLGRG